LPARVPEHDPEKWRPVFGKDHAQTENPKRALTQGAGNVDEYISGIGDDLHVPAEGPLRNP
jgi:hypothetical protein